MSPFFRLSDSPSQPSPKSMSWASVLASVERKRGGNKWNINTPVSLTLSTSPHGAAGQKAPSAVHLSPVTSTAKPSSQKSTLGWHSKRCVGTLGRLAGRLAAAAVLEGSVEHVKPQPVSPGAPHGWTGPTLSGAWSWIDPQPSHKRPPYINDSKEGVRQNVLSAFKLWFLT